MEKLKRTINAAIVALLLLLVSSLGLAYQVYATSQIATSSSVSYEEAVKATAHDCCS